MRRIALTLLVFAIAGICIYLFWPFGESDAGKKLTDDEILEQPLRSYVISESGLGAG